jgi:hypothetical protein
MPRWMAMADELPVSEAVPQESFSLTKAFATEGEAIEEAKRLNQISAAKDCVYDYRVARLVEGEERGPGG